MRRRKDGGRGEQEAYSGGGREREEREVDLTALDEPSFGRGDFVGVASTDDVHDKRRVFEEVENNTPAGIDENLERTLEAVRRRVGWKAAEQAIEAVWNTVDPVDIPCLAEGDGEGLG
jgi:hypothetical protein